MLLVEVKNLTKSYDKKQNAIENLNFEIHSGKFHVFIGSNGSGKTTTIKSIVNAYANFSGKIYIGGHLNTSAKGKGIVGYMPELPTFPKEFTLRKYIYSFALLNGLTTTEAKTKTQQIIDKLELNYLASKKPVNFSSGQKRKSILAQTLVSEPKVLIMDEPAANLDPEARRDLFEILNNFKNENKSVFISTHELHEVNKFANYVTILEKGHLVYSGEFNSNDDLEKFYFEQIKKYYEKNS